MDLADTSAQVTILPENKDSASTQLNKNNDELITPLDVIQVESLAEDSNKKTSVSPRQDSVTNSSPVNHFDEDLLENRDSTFNDYDNDKTLKIDKDVEQKG